jgi:hypothetical protein
MFFRDIYKPIPPVYNLVLALLWRHPENIELDKVNVVHYCAAVSIYIYISTLLILRQFFLSLEYNLKGVNLDWVFRDLSHGGTLARKRTWRGKI